MLKKISFIAAALLVTLAMVFVSCGSGEDWPVSTEVEVELFRLSTILKTLPDGDITANFSEIMGEDLLRIDGGMAKAEVVTEGGVKKLKFNAAGLDWGQGIDLKFAGFGFRAGDVIEIKGRDTPSVSGSAGGVAILTNYSNCVANFQSGSDGATSATGEFDKSFTLTAAEVGLMRGSPFNQNNGGARICYHSNSVHREGIFWLEELVITGTRKIGGETGPTETYIVPEVAPGELVTGKYVFYVDLNKFTNNSNISDSIVIDEEANTVAFTFAAGDDLMSFALSQLERELASATFQNSDSIKVTVDGVASSDAILRWGFRHATAGGGWAGSIVGDVKFNTQVAVAGGVTHTKNEQFGANQSGNDDSLNNTGALYFQTRNTAAVDYPLTITLKSIKVEVNEALPIDDNEIATNISPVAGKDAIFTVNGTQVTGAVTWSPAIDTDLNYWGGIFKPMTIYTASIKLSAKPGYTFDDSEAVFDSVPGAWAQYDASTQTITAIYPMTANASITGTLAISTTDPEHYRLAAHEHTATVTGGSGSYSYRWQRVVEGKWANPGTGTNPPAVTSAVYTPPVAGEYRVIATSSAADQLPLITRITIGSSHFDGEISLDKAAAARLIFTQLTASYEGDDGGLVAGTSFTWFKGTTQLGTGATYTPVMTGTDYKVVYGAQGYESLEIAFTVLADATKATLTGVAVSGVAGVTTVTVEANGGNVAATTGGVIYGSTGQSYGRQHMGFMINFGAGKSLADFEKIEFTYTGLAGDVGSKQINVRAFEAKPVDSDGWISDPTGTNCIIPRAGVSTGSTNISGVITADNAAGDANEAQSVYIIINIHANSAAWSITNIHFVELIVEGTTPFTQDLSIAGGTALGSTLTATYGGAETGYSIHWFRGGEEIDAPAQDGTAANTDDKNWGIVTGDSTGSTLGTLMPGVYTAKISKSGYVTKTSNSITVAGATSVSGIKIDLAGTEQTVEAKVVGTNGSVYANADNTGYTIITTQGHNYTGVFFQVTGDLSDYTSVTFTLKGIAGDTGWKTPAIYATATATEPAGGALGNKIGEGTQYSSNGLTEQEITIDISSTEVNPNITILIPMNKNSIYTISGITFNDD